MPGDVKARGSTMKSMVAFPSHIQSFCKLKVSYVSSMGAPMKVDCDNCGLYKHMHTPTLRGEEKTNTHKNAGAPP